MPPKVFHRPTFDLRERFAAQSRVRRIAQAVELEINLEAMLITGKLLDECRTAILSRVVALYDYRLAVERTRLDAEELQARRRAKTSTTADVATAAAGAFLNRQAAARTAYLTEDLDITRVVSTHLVSTEMSTTLAKWGEERSAGTAVGGLSPSSAPT